MKNILSIADLTLGYNKVLYSGINAKVTNGELIAVVGPNGIGKSTLLKSISGLVKIINGTIQLNNISISDYSTKELAKIVSFVPSQSPRVNNFSTYDMVSTGSYNRTNWIGNISDIEKEFTMEIVEKVGISHLIDRDSSTLSDGEFQRAAIARSLIQNTNLILLDEPTAFLDLENKAIITSLLKSITQLEKKSILFSTHDLSLAIQLCDKIWILGSSGFYNDTPENLINTGAFESMFKNSKLKFDKKFLTFI